MANGSLPNTRAIAPASPHFSGGDIHVENDRMAEDTMNNRLASIQARVRAQTRINAQNVDNGGTDGFAESMDILSADGLSSSTQRQFFNRYQIAREADADEFSAADNEAGERLLSARARYARRGHFYRSGESAASAHPVGLGPSGRPHRASSRSPTRNGGSSERLAATATVFADRAARLRAATRERVQREREFMHGDFPRFDLLHYSRPARNMGDYVVRSNSPILLLNRQLMILGLQRDEDFDPSYESLISLASTLGEARPRATPNHVIDTLPTGLYKDWQTADSDQRCPICLDDVSLLVSDLRALKMT
jgi:hypothetical protein